MRVLGIESSCDETGLAVYCTERGLLGQALHSQVDMHERYGGVVPELASRDHIRRVLPLARQALAESGLAPADLDGIAWTEGPGLAGALLVGAAVGATLAWALGRPGIGVHHLEGHLLSPLLASDQPPMPFTALLVSGGHTQLLAVEEIGGYRLLGDTLDDAAGEAFDKSAKLLGLGYPGGPALSRLAAQGRPGRFKLPRPMLHDAGLDFSFSGLKTAVRTQVARGLPDESTRAALALEVETAITEVLAAKAIRAVRESGHGRLVVAGGVSANRQLRERLIQAAERERFRVWFPPPALCTDNGAMIALAGALRLDAMARAGSLPPAPRNFRVRPRWPLDELETIAGR
ncbi:MAG: tRNA (adenosine(37)-N6)-threonylcarbamoyltransferase complex transferase subunit TsaD [Betaproteobacteria bacterium]|nr:tRNA (adenosine(37)-N6)-threonylcarbamoyltransferase complex transferase subunit TsaD [Betaproteobacteria bacterium]